MPPRIPSTLKFGSLSFKVLTLGDGRVAFAYKDGTRRRVVKRSSIDELRAEAARVSTAILNADSAALDMTADERRIYVAAREALAPTGLHLDTAARELAEAHAATGGISLAELVRTWKIHGAAGTGGTCPPTTEIVARLIERLRDDRRDARKYVEPLRRDLAAFAAAVPDIARSDEDELRKYLRNLTTHKNEPVSDRRRDNVRDGIVTLFRYARDRGWLAADRKTVAEKIKRLKPGVEVTTYTPEQLAHLLEHASARWLPWLALGAFAGMRTSEIFRLEWGAFKWDQHAIAIRRSVARKVKVARMVPINETLLHWLEAYRGHTGPLYPNKQTHGSGPTWRTLEDHHAGEIKRLVAASGIIYEQNALRHSYGSHRLAITKNVAQVAMEMGTSAAMIRKHYEDPKPDAEAVRYFALRPPHEADNVVALPLEFR